MAARRTTEPEVKKSRRPPATTPEARENQLISKAFDLAQRQLEDGSASAQVITNFLKLGSSREKLEQRRLEMETELLAAKKENMAAAARIEELYSAAIGAMRAYAGQEPPRVTDEFDD